MPTVNIGDKSALDSRNKFIQLKAKNEKVTFRIVNISYSYDGKHFLKEDNGMWDISYCPRIMEEKTCPLCEKFFEAKKQIKELKAEKDSITSGNKTTITDKDAIRITKIDAQIKELDTQVRLYNPKITFYYAILNRDNQSAQILKTVLSFRLFIDKEREQGVNVLNYDYILQRTETPGNYYTFTRIDSSMTKPLTEIEEKQIEIGKAWNIENEVVSKKTSHPIEEEIPWEG